MIIKLGLFSSNETKDDISTTNLKYLLVLFYLGELTKKIAQGDRIQILKASQAKLKMWYVVTRNSFLSVKPWSLCPEKNYKCLLWVLLILSKILERKRRQRAAEAKLLEMKERKERRCWSTRAAAISTPVESGEEDVLDDDGEEEKEAWLTTISLALCKAFDLLEMLKKEEEMLSATNAKKLEYHINDDAHTTAFQGVGDKEVSPAIFDERAKKAEAWHRDAAAWAKFTKPAAPITCATFAQDVIEGRKKVSDALEHKHQPMIFGPASLVGKKTQQANGKGWQRKFSSLITDCQPLALRKLV